MYLILTSLFSVSTFMLSQSPVFNFSNEIVCRILKYACSLDINITLSSIFWVADPLYKNYKLWTAIHLFSSYFLSNNLSFFFSLSFTLHFLFFLHSLPSLFAHSLCNEFPRVSSNGRRCLYRSREGVRNPLPHASNY